MSTGLFGLGAFLVFCGLMVIKGNGLTFDLIMRKLKGGTPTSKEFARQELARIGFGAFFIILGGGVIFFSFYH